MTALVVCVPSCFQLTLLFVLQCFFLFPSYNSSLLFHFLSIHLTLTPSCFHLTLSVLETRRSSDLKAMSFVILKLCHIKALSSHIKCALMNSPKELGTGVNQFGRVPSQLPQDGTLSSESPAASLKDTGTSCVSHRFLHPLSPPCLRWR